VLWRAAAPARDASIHDDHVHDGIRRAATFVAAFVFDLAQTEGRPLVEVCSRLSRTLGLGSGPVQAAPP
jgi:hypothetical protein